MFTLIKLAVLLTVATSVAAMPSHMARQLHHHREIAARVAIPEVPSGAEMSPPPKRFVRRKRNGRCSSSNGGSFPPASTPTGPTPSPMNPESTPANPESTPSNPESTPADPESTPMSSTYTPSNPESTPSSSDPSPTIQDDARNRPSPTTTTPSSDPESTTPTPQPNDTPTSTSPTPTSTSGGGDGQVHTGQGTFYATGLGACGITNNDGQDIAAVSHLFFDSFPGYNGVNPNTNPMCGKSARVTYKGKTVTVQLTDRCEACAYDDLDFSPHAFDQLADESEGRISGIQWEIIN